MPDNADIERLLHAYIDSPAQLETLATMAANATRSWNAQDVADMFGVSHSQASRDLELLCARNLLDVRITNSVRYRFSPGQSRIAEDMDVLLTAYRERPALVASMATSQARTRNIRAFADAFRLKKKDRG